MSVAVVCLAVSTFSRIQAGAKQSKLSYRLRSDDFLFENLYLRKGDSDEEDESVVSE